MLFGMTVSVKAQIINFPDANFKAKLVQASTTNPVALNTALQPMVIDTNGNGEIEIPEALAVYQLSLDNSNITNLSGIENFVNLGTLYCAGDNIPTINLTSCAALKDLNLNNSHINSLLISNLANVENVNANNNNLTNLDLTGLANLKNLFLDNNNLIALNISGLTSLEQLNCDYNEIVTLNLTALPNLNYVKAQYGHLTSLTLSDLPKLVTARFVYNELASVFLSDLPLLEELNFNTNQLTSFAMGDYPKLKRLEVPNNQLTSVTFGSLPLLNYLDVSGNQLTSIDVNGFPLLTDLYCGNNLLTTLDVSNCSMLNGFFLCNDNQLVSLFLKNANHDAISFYGNPTLQYICADENEIAYLQNAANTLGYTCVINSYCTFVPGGGVHLLTAVSSFDANSNGCDLSDPSFFGLKFNVTNGTNLTNFVSTASGNCLIPLQTGTYTITPVFETPLYFTVSPTSKTLTLPTGSSNLEQNFCIAPNGSHPNLEVVILPIGTARPGFDAKYKIICRNKGNVTLSGSVDFTFEDAKLDYVSSIPAVSSQSTNLLTWNFTNLQPSQNKEIQLLLNVNGPTDIPSVNVGDQLNFSVTANPLAGDDEPENNVFGFKQTVVNSFDPNEKTCLEGEVVSPDMIGQYVHYVIRFENTGTANAQNIVVKDLIDTTKFDVSTLVPISGSAPFTTRISDTNKVEFIFENIDLPFDDANNDGYVAFKIKTMPTLIVGDTFANNASIYFDYNFPVVTNTATTMVQLLGTPDFDFSDHFTLSPNPTKNILNIRAKDATIVRSLSVYNVLGQLVLAIPNPETTESVDVSDLKAGNYFIKIHSDKGNSFSKFIKE